MRGENSHHWRCLGCPRKVCLLSFFVPFSYGLDMECPYPLQPLPDVVHMYTDYGIYAGTMYICFHDIQCFYRCMMYVYMHMSTIDFSQLPLQLRY